jgi:hypothetical protein
MLLHAVHRRSRRSAGESARSTHAAGGASPRSPPRAPSRPGSPAGSPSGCAGRPCDERITGSERRRAGSALESGLPRPEKGNV